VKRANRHDILRELTQKWDEVGKRHLYLVLGRCEELAVLARELANARTPDRQPLGAPLSVNGALLRLLEQRGDLDRLDGGEAKYPTMVRERLAQEFEALLKDALARRHVIVLTDLELLFAFDLDLALLRLHATNGRHVVLLLPGQRVGERILLFHEVEERFHRTLPTNLVMDTHVWEIAHGD
jgi:hypothetical protein